MGMRERNEEVDSAREKLLLIGDAWHARADAHWLSIGEVAIGALRNHDAGWDGLLVFLDRTASHVHHHDRRWPSKRFRRDGECNTTALPTTSCCWCCCRLMRMTRRAHAHCNIPSDISLYFGYMVPFLDSIIHYLSCLFIFMLIFFFVNSGSIWFLPWWWINQM